jgi:hypothetical protein
MCNSGSISRIFFFSYFTNLANIFAANVLLWNALTSHKAPAGRGNEILRLMAVINMSVVGVVFALLIRGTDLGSLLPWVNFVLHYLMPCVVILDWVLLPPRSPLALRDLWICQIFPPLYLCYLLVRGSMVGWYPYPFLNPVNVGGYDGVAMYASGVALVFILGGWLLIVLANKRSPNESRRR